MPTNDLKYVATYPSREEAEVMEGLLNANGIKCFLQFNEVGDGLMGALGQINGPTERMILI